MKIALYEPDIPQNTGTILRMCACLGVEAHLIGPASFPMTDRAFRRAGMDYLDQLTVTRHVSWTSFDEWRRELGLRLVLMSTHADASYLDCRYSQNDIILLGRESVGVPEAVHQAADLRIKIPMHGGMRSLNVAVACAMAVGEALRQINGFTTT